ncbi:transcriptional regulator [Candidatus Bipolaricaulota bacterium]
MSQRKQLLMLLSLGVLLLVIGAAIAAPIVSRYQRIAWDGFRESCHAQVATFEEYVEYLIVRDQLDFIPAAARLLLLGAGLYVDVILPDETLLSEQDVDLDASLVPGSIDLADLPFDASNNEIHDGVLEITAPISLSGHVDSVIGVIRIGFTGEIIASRIRQWARAAAGIGAGTWLVVMVGLSGVLWIIQRRRRTEFGEDEVIQLGRLTIDQRTREVRWSGTAVEMTPKLFGLLLLFARDPGAVLSDDDILPVLWPDSPYAAASDVKQCVYMLRQRFARVSTNPKKLIANVKGFGYRLDPSAFDEDLTQI